MSEEDARDWAEEPMVRCKNCGEPVLVNDRDEWGYCPRCARNEDEEDYNEEEVNYNEDTENRNEDEGDDNEATN